ncbi:MAG TPA: glycosyltransferase [Candidatus Limnocylindria bacterium]|nr:glycosyltransferase [Candidatus Limnocylindria bacterium]
MTVARRAPRLLLISMYPLDQGVWGATQRIRQLRDELARRTRLDVIHGYRGPRRMALARYAASGRLRGLDGIYVENSTMLPSETDVAFLALARALGIPVLTYLRDAQQLFDEYYPLSSVKRRLSRRLFLPAMRALMAVSTRVAFPSAGLARAILGAEAECALLLPPGSRRPVDVPLEPTAPSLLFVGGLRFPVQGGDILFEAIERARADGHPVELICVSRPHEEPPRPHPRWLHVQRAMGEEIDHLLPAVRASITPRRRSPYNDLAVPIKVLEYLSYARPLIVTDCTEQAAIVRSTGSGVVVEDSADGLARGITEVFSAPPAQVEAWSVAARRAAEENSWARRAGHVLEILGLEP